MNTKISFFIRATTAILIVVSIAMMYYTKIVVKDYDILTNEDGPTLDE